MRKAQASIEATLSLICLALLLMGGLRIYLWSVKHAVERQQKYEQDRVKATESVGPFLVEGAGLPKLDVFAESGTKD